MSSKPTLSAHSTHSWPMRWAKSLLARPRVLIAALLVLGTGSGVLASRLTINSNQLDLISQNLRQVKDVKRVIDMVGGSGFLMLAFRAENEEDNKKAADAVAAMLEEDKEHIRSVTYRMPVEFAQQNVGLFVSTEDLLSFRQRVTTYLRAMTRYQNPFVIRLHDAKPPTLEIQDIVDKYSHVGKKTILDDYYISSDRKMLLMLVKPKWDTNELGKTNELVLNLRDRFKNLQVPGHDHKSLRFAESYTEVGQEGVVTFGFGGSYMSSLDDSFAIQRSLEPVGLWAFGSIVAITVLFFRRIVPSLIVLTGMVLGTVITMGFCYISVGQLNMITSILGGILMGFGVDYGIHYVFRTRIELASGHAPKDAAAYALIHAGRPASIAAIVTGGSFLTLTASGFRGFSQFGFLAGFGTLIIGLTMFLWCAGWIALLSEWAPERIEGWIGVLHLPHGEKKDPSRVPKPGLLLGAAGLVVLALCAIAVPKSQFSDLKSGWHQRLLAGVTFNYNSRALMAEDQYSVILQDEINRRFGISSDPVAVVTDNLEQSHALYEEMTRHADKYPTVDQVMSLWTFVPPLEQARKNSAIMAEWHKELEAYDLSVLSSADQAKAQVFLKALEAKPYTVDQVPEVYRSQFYNLPETRPENRGMLTFIYPRVDLWDGVQMLSFADEVDSIKTDHGEFHAAGAPLLFAQLARIVLFDGKMTLVLAAIWILIMHYLDFRSVVLALASVLPLVLGLGMMLGLMALTLHPLNFMNIIMLPILLGFGVSHGLYLLHRFLEGVPTTVALKSVGAAVASSTCTAIAGFAALFAASHQGLKSMGYVACLGLSTTLIASFTVLAAVLQLIEDRERKSSDRNL